MIGSLNSIPAQELEKMAAALDSKVYKALAHIDHLERDLDQRLKTAPRPPVSQVLSMYQDLGVEACVRQYQNLSAVLTYFTNCQTIAKWLDGCQDAAAVMNQAKEMPDVLPLLVDGLEGNGGRLLEQVLAKSTNRDKLNEDLADIALARLREEMKGLETNTWLVMCVEWQREQGPWQKLQGALKEYAMALARGFLVPMSTCERMFDGWNKANSRLHVYRESLRRYEAKETERWRQFVLVLRQCFVEGLNTCFCENIEKMDPTIQMMSLLAKVLTKENAMKAIGKLRSKRLVLDERTNLLDPAGGFELQKFSECAVSFIDVIRDRLMEMAEKVADEDGCEMDKICRLLGNICKCKDARPAPWFFKERLECVDSVLSKMARVFFRSQKAVNSIFSNLLARFEWSYQETARNDGVLDVQIGIVLKVIGLWSERLPYVTAQAVRSMESDVEYLRNALPKDKSLSFSLPWIGQVFRYEDIEFAFWWPALIQHKLTVDCREWKELLRSEKDVWQLPLLELLTGGKIEAMLPNLKHR